MGDEVYVEPLDEEAVSLRSVENLREYCTVLGLQQGQFKTPKECGETFCRICMKPLKCAKGDFEWAVFNYIQAVTYILYSMRQQFYDFQRNNQLFIHTDLERVVQYM